MKRKNVILTVAVLAAIGFLVGGYIVFGRFASSQNLNADKQAQNAETQRFVVALGRLEPADKVIKLTAPQSNGGGNPRIAKLFVKEGEEITEGQIVAELDGKEKQRAVVSEAFEGVKIAESKLAQIKAGAKRGDLEAQKADIERLETEIRKAAAELNRTKFPTVQKTVPAPEYVAITRLEADLENAEIELRRAENLYAKGDVSKSALDARQTTVKTLQREIERAEATLKTVADERQLNSIKREIERARATLQTATDDRSLSVATLTQDLERARASYASLAEVRPTDVNTAAAEVANAKAALETARSNIERFGCESTFGRQSFENSHSRG